MLWSGGVINPKDDISGSSLMTLSVTDGTETISQQFIINVSPVNDEPVFDVISDQNMNEGGSKVILLSASDVDEDDLTYSITEGTNITSSIEGSTITFSLDADDDWNGSEEFTATVADAEYTQDQTFTVTVDDVNDALIQA